jgi:peptide/nickel transport system ATP-binding protein
MPLLEVQKLSVAFPKPGGYEEVLREVSFCLEAGETLALIGESGGGKSVLIEALLRLLPRESRVSGRAFFQFQGRDLLAMPLREHRSLLGQKIAWIPQAATEALHPLLPVGFQLAEPLLVRGIPRREAYARLVGLFRALDLPEEALHRYPHQLSGGMRQRALVAGALATGATLVLADEPTKGVDVLRKDQTIALFQKSRVLNPGMGLLLVTHDLPFAQALAQKVVVLYAGKVVEEGKAQTFFQGPLHPYAQALLEALPERGFKPLPLGLGREGRGGCPFFPFCPEGSMPCEEGDPPLFQTPKGRVRCWRYGDTGP